MEAEKLHIRFEISCNHIALFVLKLAGAYTLARIIWGYNINGIFIEQVKNTPLNYFIHAFFMREIVSKAVLLLYTCNLSFVYLKPQYKGIYVKSYVMYTRAKFSRACLACFRQ